MTLFKAFATVIGTAICFGIVGTGNGAFLGLFTPSLFHSLFNSYNMEMINPLEIGIGLGLINGLA